LGLVFKFKDVFVPLDVSFASKKTHIVSRIILAEISFHSQSFVMAATPEHSLYGRIKQILVDTWTLQDQAEEAMGTMNERLLAHCRKELELNKRELQERQAELLCADAEVAPLLEADLNDATANVEHWYKRHQELTDTNKRVGNLAHVYRAAADHRNRASEPFAHHALHDLACAAHVCSLLQQMLLQNDVASYGKLHQHFFLDAQRQASIVDIYMKTLLPMVTAKQVNGLPLWHTFLSIGVYDFAYQLVKRHFITNYNDSPLYNDCLTPLQELLQGAMTTQDCRAILRFITVGLDPSDAAPGSEQESSIDAARRICQASKATQIDAEHLDVMKAPPNLLRIDARVQLLTYDKALLLAQWRRIQLSTQLVSIWNSHADEVRLCLFQKLPQVMCKSPIDDQWSTAAHVINAFLDFDPLEPENVQLEQQFADVTLHTPPHPTAAPMPRRRRWDASEHTIRVAQQQEEEEDDSDNDE
jgi:hypothetical protein